MTRTSCAPLSIWWESVATGRIPSRSSSNGTLASKRCGACRPTRPWTSASFWPAFILTTPSTIAVDTTGAVIIGGATDVDDLPVTSGAYAQHCGCQPQQFGGFVAKIGSNGTKLIWGTYLPLADPAGYSGAGFNGVKIAALVYCL